MNEMRRLLRIVEALDDSHYENDGSLRDDPNHKLIKDRGIWGSSHYYSSEITGHSATKMGIDGYHRKMEDEPEFGKLAYRKLRAIADSPGSPEPLYHGFQNRKHHNWTVGETLTLPLTATSATLQGSASYGVRLDPDDNVGPPTVFEFPKGTKMVGYTKWKQKDAEEFGYLWTEAIVAGKFRVVGVRKIQYAYTWRDDIFLTVVRLEPVSYFDPDTNEWVDYEVGGAS